MNDTAYMAWHALGGLLAGVVLAAVSVGGTLLYARRQRRQRRRGTGWVQR